MRGIGSVGVAMILFPNGLKVNPFELQCLNHVVANVEDWLAATLDEKINRRREVLLNQWQTRLLTDPDYSSLPADSDALCRVIFDHPDYKSRYEQEVDNQIRKEFSLLDPTTRRLSDMTRVEVDSISRFNTAKYNSTRRTSGATLLFPTGLEISDLDAQCLRAFIVDIEDWVHGAILGMINRGKKKMITQYRPVIMSDPSVTNMPATESGLIDSITKRADYRTAVIEPTDPG